jgi:hypothetical protein
MDFAPWSHLVNQSVSQSLVSGGNASCGFLIVTGCITAKIHSNFHKTYFVIMK